MQGSYTDRRHYFLNKKKSLQQTIFNHMSTTSIISPYPTSSSQHNQQILDTQRIQKQIKTAIRRKTDTLTLYKEQLELKQKQHKDNVQKKKKIKQSMVDNLEYLLKRQREYNRKMGEIVEKLEGRRQVREGRVGKSGDGGISRFCDVDDVVLMYTAKQSLEGSSVSFSFFDAKNQ